METGPGQNSQGASVTVDKPYVYQETEVDIMGPVLPDIGGLGEAGYLQHIRSVSDDDDIFSIESPQVRVRGGEGRGLCGESGLLQGAARGHGRPLLYAKHVMSHVTMC